MRRFYRRSAPLPLHTRHRPSPERPVIGSEPRTRCAWFTSPNASRFRAANGGQWSEPRTGAVVRQNDGQSERLPAWRLPPSWPPRTASSTARTLRHLPAATATPAELLRRLRCNRPLPRAFGPLRSRCGKPLTPAALCAASFAALKARPRQHQLATAHLHTAPVTNNLSNGINTLTCLALPGRAILSAAGTQVSGQSSPARTGLPQ